MNKEESASIIPAERIQGIIYYIRGHKVILDQDLASLYQVETKQFNRSVKRNRERFPIDFAFKLTKNEWDCLRCQIGTSNSERGGRRYLPLVFTEHGALMAANILRSKQAIKMSIEIVRAFIKLRQTFLSHKALIKEIKEIREFVLKNSLKTDREFKRVWNAIEKLSASPPKPEREEPRIGFRLN